EDVLRRDLTKLYERHEKFPEIVLTCAIDDNRYDVIEILLNQNVPCRWNPLFKFKWVNDKTALLGISQENLESAEDLEKKFKMVDFLIEKKVLDEKVIPKHLIGEWREFKGIKIGSTGNQAIYFVLILISLFVAMCLSLVF
ncbi:hypothetical protein EBS02_10945, partial [bacterium]|nr:hypothetical protein [bacterium]